MSWVDINPLGEQFAKTGKEEDFNKLYEPLRLYLSKFIYARNPRSDPFVREEAIALTINSIWENRKQFDSSKAQFRSWATTILIRNYLLASGYSKRRTKRVLTLNTLDENFMKYNHDSHTQKEETETELAMKNYDLEEKIGMLPEDLQDLVTLKYLKGWSYKDIQDLYPEPVNTLKTKIRRGRLILKRIYEEEYIERNGKH